MALIAITGDIGAGKSTVAVLYAKKFSCPILNADEITGLLWQLDSIKGIFVDRWNNKILDDSGNIIKSEISKRIFSDFNEYKFCVSVFHPLVMAEIQAKHEELSSAYEYIVAEIPLLFEACETPPDWINHIVYVTADFETRLSRVQAQRGWNIDELKRRESFLLPNLDKMKLSNEIIKNNGSFQDLFLRIML